MIAPQEKIYYYEWKSRFINHIVNTLTKVPTDWTAEQAQRMAEGEFEGNEFEIIYDGFENDPEGSADESMSYWADYADEIPS